MADVKRYLDLLAPYKFNVLHLHLTDDQGWRIEIKAWPRLAEYGGSTAVDGAPGGYYTQEQYADIVRYAASATSPSSPKSTCRATRTPRWLPTPD